MPEGQKSTSYRFDRQGLRVQRRLLPREEVDPAQRWYEAERLEEGKMDEALRRRAVSRLLRRRDGPGDRHPHPPVLPVLSEPPARRSLRRLPSGAFAAPSSPSCPLCPRSLLSTGWI